MLHASLEPEGIQRMDPRRLAEKFGNLAAASSAKATEMQRQNEDHAQRQKATSDAIEDKLRNVVLPYLQETMEAFPEKTFEYEPYNDGVKITIKGFQPVVIRNVGGKVEVQQFRFDANTRQLVRMGTYSSTKDPFIGTSDDLTREKVGRLIDIMMDDAKRS
jgi:hypothetical protein